VDQWRATFMTPVVVKPALRVRRARMTAGGGAIEADRLVGFGELVGDEEEDGGGLGDEGELFAGGEGDRLGAGEAVLAADGGAEVDAEDVAGVVGGGGDGDRGVGAA
jgi:hypothetical protein